MGINVLTGLTKDYPCDCGNPLMTRILFHICAKKCMSLNRIYALSSRVYQRKHVCKLDQIIDYLLLSRHHSTTDENKVPTSPIRVYGIRFNVDYVNFVTHPSRVGSVIHHVNSL